MSLDSNNQHVPGTYRHVTTATTYITTECHGDKAAYDGDSDSDIVPLHSKERRAQKRRREEERRERAAKDGEESERP